jgi:hypothetical protein
MLNGKLALLVWKDRSPARVADEIAVSTGVFVTHQFKAIRFK